MIKIADIKELKLNITWKLLYRGLLEKMLYFKVCAAVTISAVASFNNSEK